MHKTFIEHVLHNLHQNGYSIEDCIYVLPSKRSGVFLKHHLSQILNKTLFAPTIISIEDFVQEVSGIKKASNVQLMLSLYECYLDIPNKQHDDFEAFIKWGETLLQDFNEIDRYLLPAHEILNYLKSIKEIDHWSLQPKKTPLVKSYLDFWENIEALYHNFNKRLTSKKRGHQGLIYRVAAKNIIEYTQKNINAPIIFMGFNALNTAESTIIQHLLENTQCEIYWDIDHYFLNDPIHDAGLFIRRYIKEWPYYNNNEPKGIYNYFLSSKKIEITGVPKSISQAKYIGHILGKHVVQNPEMQDSLAIVLADESLLSPVSRAIPTGIENVNITMGLSLRSSLLYSLFNSIFELMTRKTHKGWFYKDVLNFITNPYFKTLADSFKSNFVHTLVTTIKANTLTYIDDKFLSQHFSESNVDLTIFPFKAKAPNSILEYCIFLILALKELFKTEKKALELQYLYTFHELFQQIKTQLENIKHIKTISTVHTFFKQLATMETLDFIGSPLIGPQLMGVLESRTLDFETVVISSVNEGILPSGKSNSSFIPFDVKREYGLPTYKEKDAIYTYHFYRLLQRAKNIHILYNTEPDVLEGGEKSRLISQLLTDYNLKSFISHNIASPQIQIETEVKEHIEKTPLLLSELETLAAKGFSPTSLSNYIKSPITFYRKHVLGIQDSIQVQENIAANTFGTIIHDVLYLLYQPFLGQSLSPENIALAIKKINPTVKDCFDKHLPGTDLEKGRYLLIFHVIERYVQNFMAMELKLAQHHQIKVLHLEEKFETTLHVKELSFPIKLKGFIDRIDEFDGVIRVIDYKTGITEPSHVKVKEWDELISNHTKSKAFQLLCYAYLLSENKEINAMIAGIYSIKNVKHGLLSFSKKNNSIINHEVLQAFRTELHNLILEIYNPDIPFMDDETDLFRS